MVDLYILDWCETGGLAGIFLFGLCVEYSALPRHLAALSLKTLSWPNIGHDGLHVLVRLLLAFSLTVSWRGTDLASLQTGILWNHC